MGTPADSLAHESSEDALMERLLGSTLGVWDICMVYLGDQLGLYRILADVRTVTSHGLARAAGLDERYVREWLEQQAVSGIVVVDASTTMAERRFSLPQPYADVLANRLSPNFLAPLAQLVIGAVLPIHAVKDAFRTGQGVPFEEYGADLRRGQAGMNRHLFMRQLGAEYFPAIPDLHDRLRADPPARIADIGCGLGWSSIGMAQAYPKVHVDGFDLDAASVEEAARNVAGADVSGRVHISLRDAGDPSLAGRYDLVTAFECIHDMPDPVRVLGTMRRLANETGTVLVMDERVGEQFDPAGTTVIEKVLYGFSVLHCLPAGRVDSPSVATGTIMRPATLKQYAQAAGFRDIVILPLENDFFTFYRLVD